MANDASNVSVGKPKASGAVYLAPSGTQLPTDATSELSPAYKNLGYVSQDGVVNSLESETSDTHAWGGDLVLSEQTTFKETFTLNMIEGNAEVFKAFYGANNVTVDGTDITIQQSTEPLPEVVLVIELVLTGGRVKRIVVPRAKIVDRSGEISYRDDTAIAYPARFAALTDASGNTHTEYIASTS